MSISAVDVVIIGGGIAGWSAAYFAARAGRDVTLVDAGLHRASDLPIALVNPLRGKNGRIVPRGIEGMRATFAVIDRLCDAGHRIACGRGFFRPLIGVAPQMRDEAYWKALVPADFAIAWHAHAPQSLGLASPVPALRLHEAGWVAPRGLLEALKTASRATVVDDEVVSIDVDPQTRAGAVVLASGPRLAARSLLWCGGAWGVARLEETPGRAIRDTGLPVAAIYKPGCLVTTPMALTHEALSFGLYAVPLPDGGTLIGPTREHGQPDFPDATIPEAAIARLTDRVAHVFGKRIEAASIWRGVRLVRTSSTASHALRGVPAITALGSRGFLMAPLFAAEWARSL